MFDNKSLIRFLFAGIFLLILIFIPGESSIAENDYQTIRVGDGWESLSYDVIDPDGIPSGGNPITDAQTCNPGGCDIPLDEETYQQYLKPVEYPDGLSRAVLPTSYDARDDGLVTSPKNQGACGSCWAFASVGALESHLKAIGLPEGSTYDYSEQQLVSCNSSQLGCCGGGSTALQYWETAGPIAESCFTYGESSTECTISSPIESTIDCSDASSCTQLDYRVTNWHTVSTSDFKGSLYIDGPSYWRFSVYDDFNAWYNTASSGSVYVNGPATNYLGGHAVLLIGWDDSKGAYLLKNSWGPTSGPQGDGTFWMAYSGHANDLSFQMVNFDLFLPGSGDSYEPDNTSGEANLISSGSPQTHSLAPAGDQDWVKFTLTSESGITLETSGASGDTRMWLYDSSLTEIDYNDDDGINNFSFIDRVCGVDALPAGTYYVQVTEYWGIELPSYDLSFNASFCSSDSYEPDDSSVEANLITNGSPQTHNIFPSGDEDWVKFTLSFESGVTLETSGISGDTRMWLYDSGLTEVEFSDDDEYSLFSYIDRVCEADALPAGTYYVKVDEFGDDEVISSYDLSLTVTPCLSYNFLPLVIGGTGSASGFNGDFELGHTGWTESSSSTDDLITNAMPVTPHSGTWLAKFGVNNSETDQLSQVVNIPVDETVLHYWYWIPSADSLWGWDFFLVKIDGTVLDTIDLFSDNITMGWTERVLDLAAYAGSDVTLSFEVTTDTVEPSILYLDDVSLESYGSTGFNSQFNGDTTGWESHSGTWYVDNDYYYSAGLIGAYSSASYSSNFNDFDYQVQMWRYGSAINTNNIIIRGTPNPLDTLNRWDSYYSFQYSKDGYFSVWKKLSGDSPVALQSWTSSSAILTYDNWNTLQVIANGSNLQFYINGTLVWSGTDTSLSSGRVGLSMYRDDDGINDDILYINWATLTTPSGTSTFEIRDSISIEQQLLNEMANQNPVGDINSSE
jgi:hypothetical protein